MFFRLKLRAFVRAHPPHAGNVPATKEMCAAYQGLLPAALLELWRKHGLSYYRKLMDTDEDIAVLDPATRSSDVLSWDLEDFFNSDPCTADCLDALICAQGIATCRMTAGQGEPSGLPASGTILALRAPRLAATTSLYRHDCHDCHHPHQR